MSMIVARARQILNDWNVANPGREIAWEWVEELLIAWKILGEACYHGRDETVPFARALEFERRIPPPLVSSLHEVISRNYLGGAG